MNTALYQIKEKVSVVEMLAAMSRTAKRLAAQKGKPVLYKIEQEINVVCGRIEKPQYMERKTSDHR